MELQYYETIRETGHLQVRFEPVLSPAGVFPAHWHEYVEILYIKDGVLSAIVQTVEYELHTGDLMIINSGDLHMHDQSALSQVNRNLTGSSKLSRLFCRQQPAELFSVREYTSCQLLPFLKHFCSFL